MRKLIVILFVIIVGSANAQTDPDYVKKLESLYKNTVELIQPLTAFTASSKSEVVFLDTRSDEEYRTSHIKNARFVDYKTFRTSQVSDIAKDKTIVVYCSVGYRSERIGEKLLKSGYKKVFNLYGGIFEWINQGYPVYDKTGKTKRVHAYSKEWAKYLK